MGKVKTTGRKKGMGTCSKIPAVCIRNRAYTKRMTKLNAAQIIFERGIYLEDFKNTNIPEVVAQRRWENFVKLQGMANVTLVKEFYASMNPEVVKSGGAVLVRNMQVWIRASTINAHFSTPNYDDINDGYSLSSLNKNELAKALRGSEDNRWDSGHELKQSELPQWLAFWNLFHTFSLMPARHRSTLSLPRARLLHCYMSQSRIDIGKVILSAIIDKGRINLHPNAKLKPIIFPSLIYALLKKEGVPEQSTDQMQSNTMGDLNLRSWQDITIKTKGKKRRRSATGSGPEDAEAEFDFEGDGLESDEDDVDYDAASGSSKLDLILDVVEGIKLNLSGVKELTEKLHTRMDVFEAELRDQRDNAAAIRKEASCICHGVEMSK